MAHVDDNSPKIVSLKEIPPGGASYSYKREDSVLNEVLSDLITGHDFSIKVQITPIGDAFQITGRIKASQEFTCSRCAFEFDHKINLKINEIVMIEEHTLGRTDHSARTNHMSDNYDASAPFCSSIKTDQLNLAELLHEIIAIETPLQPVAPQTENHNCSNNLKIAREKGLYSPEYLCTPTSEVNTYKPFAGLESFKVKN